MSIDKFGHFSNDRDFSLLFKREVECLTGIYLDTDGHINVQKRRIKNSSKPINGNDLSIKFYVDDKINEAKSHQMETITKSFQLRNKRVSELESKVIKMITQMEYIHNSIKEFVDKLENFNKFINQHLKKPPPIIRSDQTQIDGIILRKSPFAHRVNEEEVLTINVDHT